MKTQKMVCIEGIDGSGKSVQFQMLKEKLKQLGKTSKDLSFPVYESFIGKEIGNMLSGKNSVRADNVDSKSMALWFAIDRLNAFLKIDLKEYDYVLLNRYTLSNAVYQGLRVEDADKAEFAKWVFQLEHEELKLPKPDQYIILDVNEKISSQNVSKKGYREYIGYEPDVYEKSAKFIDQARNLYLEFSKTLDNVSVIQCMKDGQMLSPEKIHGYIMEVIN